MPCHWREAGIRDDNLYKLYCCYVRSRMEYMSAVYHSMLHRGHVESLERLHRFALRVCYGFEGDIRRVMSEKGIERLEDRRRRRFDTFITRTANNPRFAHWFPIRPGSGFGLRRRREVEEIRSRTERRHRGPMAAIRRRANELGLFNTSSSAGQ